MNEKLTSALKNKYSYLGLSDTQIEGVSAFLATSVTSDEGIDTAVTSAEPLLKMLQSENDRARTASAKLAETIKELETKIKGFEDSDNPKPKPPKKNPEDKDEPEYVKKMMEMMQSLTTEVTAIKGDKIKAQRNAEIANLTDGLPDSIKAVYARQDYTKYDEAEYAELKKRVAEETSLITKEINTARGFNPPFSHSGNGEVKKATSKEIEEVMKFMPKTY